MLDVEQHKCLSFLYERERERNREVTGKVTRTVTCGTDVMIMVNRKDDRKGAKVEGQSEA